MQDISDTKYKNMFLLKSINRNIKKYAHVFTYTQFHKQHEEIGYERDMFKEDIKVIGLNFLLQLTVKIDCLLML